MSLNIFFCIILVGVVHDTTLNLCGMSRFFRLTRVGFCEATGCVNLCIILSRVYDCASFDTTHGRNHKSEREGHLVYMYSILYHLGE